MSKPISIPIWKTAPFIRLLLPFTGGIILQWYVQMLWLTIIAGMGCFAIAYILFSFLPAGIQFRLQIFKGIFLHLLLLYAGMFLTWNKDARHNPEWYGHFYKEGDFIVATIKEPLIEKTKSYKADAGIEQLITNDTTIACNGKLLLYFSKDSTTPQLAYGDKILLNKKLIDIKNSGNPGAFNYQRYAAFQQIFHNAFLKQSDWIKLKEKNVNPFKQFIFRTRQKILAILQQYISSGKDELGIAQALLIGYTNDLDKDLVQAYSNTGVVHIIAISGMHLGLIYGMLLWLFARIPFINKSKPMQAFSILACLWLFSLLTGGAASVIRSAVMFSFITIGKSFFKQASIFNSLAASAFVMLCYNPYYLWDVGFQLSYLAVVGIIVFQKPIYNLLYVKNKIADNIWKAAALATAAQVLTFPVCIYYFHQFPLLFLFTNLVAVPLSTGVLYAAIFLVAFAWVPYAGLYAGKLTGFGLWVMNKFILLVNSLPFAVWDKIPANIFTTWLLYATVIFAALWLLNQNKKMLRLCLIACTGFVFIHGIISWQIKSQQKLIVYNVPQHQAIDFISGNNYRFAGDSVLLEDGLLQNFHLKPGRTAMQLNKRTDTLPGLFTKENFYQFGNKKIMLLNEAVSIEPRQSKINVDIIVISHSPNADIPQLAAAFNCSQYIFDASNSLWKIGKWKEDCDKLHLRHHSVPVQGAFVMDIE